MARIFDAYIIVDWSAASKPSQGANSVWIGALADGLTVLVRLTNHRQVRGAPAVGAAYEICAEEAFTEAFRARIAGQVARLRTA